MLRYLIGNFVLLLALSLVGCAPAEVQPPPDTIPTILPGRSAPASGSPAGGGEAASGRIPTAPR